MDQDKIEKIKALLAKAEDKAATPEESESYFAKASELITKYGIDEALLTSQDASRREDIVYVRLAPIGPVTYSKEFVLMGIQVARPLGVEALYAERRVYDEKRSEWKSVDDLGLIGFKSDVDRVELLWRSLEIQLASALSLAVKQNLSYKRTAMEKYKFRRDFIAGYGVTVGQRLKEIYQRVVEQTGGAGTDLVLADRKTLVKSWMDDNLSTRPTKSKNYSTTNGAHHGAAAGEKASLGQADIGNPNQKKLGN